jgi:hypothetical protein
MKTFLKGAGFVIVGYLLISLVNMGTVVLFFYERVLASVYILFPLQLLIIAPTSYGIGYLLTKWFNPENSIPVYILAGLVTIVIAINIISDVSLEPLWYKISYLVIVIPALILSNKKKEQPDT